MIEADAQARRAVALVIADAELQRAVRVALRAHPGLTLVPDAELAQVLITDGVVPSEPGPPVIVVAEEPSSEAATVLPPDEPELVVAAAYLIASGYRVLRGAQPNAGANSAAEAPHLTPRERQVLDLLVSGASNKHIANALAISPHTAKFHVTAVLEKLGARNRSDAVGIALRDGHVTL